LIVLLHGWRLFTFVLSLLELLNQLSQRGKLFLVNEVELVNEIDEVLETCVEMGLSREEHDMLEMSMVDVGVNSEESLENNLDDVDEVFGEGHSELTREDLFVVELILYPSHEEVNVFRCTDFKGSLDVVTVSPEIFIFRAS
jgi:hypothetical protein